MKQFKSSLTEVIIFFAAIFLNCHHGASQKRDYSGYTVLRSSASSQEQLNLLRLLKSNNANSEDRSIEFWTEPHAVNSSVDILVGPDRLANLERKLSKMGIPSVRFIEDVGKAIETTSTSYSPDIHGNASLRQSISAQAYYNQFQRYAVIEAKIREIEEKDPRVSVAIIGKSYEQRNIYLVKVSNDFSARKPVVFIDAGHHAREWISHATIMYLLESLVNIDIPRMPSRYCRHDECRRETQRLQSRLDLDKFDYWFIPVVNPDGYEYSHTTDRLWRKTRSGSFCRGVDPNRNYPFHWNESGSSSYSCSDIYAGPRAQSEPEVRAVTSVLDQYKYRIQMYISLHCYSQLILSPYGYARVYPNNYKELDNVASSWIKAMNRLRATDYTFGTSAITLYPSSGGSDDYAHSIGIPLAYTIELPDKGRNGFITPPSEIVPIAHEALIGLQSMIDSVAPATVSQRD